MNLLYKNIIKKLKFLIPLNSVTLEPYLSPILGQYNIKVDDFLKKFIIEFNILTNNFFITEFRSPNEKLLAPSLNLIVRVYVLVYQNFEYSINLLSPNSSFLYNLNNKSTWSNNLKALKKSKNFVIYKIACLKSFVSFNFGFNKNLVKFNYLQIRYSLNKKIKVFRIF
jgi:ribosomal protein L11